MRQRLLEVASQIIAQHGADALSMRKVATAAETTTAAIYSLFGGREALIEAVIVEGFARFAQHLKAVVHTADPAADLLSLGIAYRANALDNPHFYRVMFNDIYGATTAQHSDETFGMLVAAVRRVTQDDELTARIRARRVWAYIHGLVSLELAGLFDHPVDTSSPQEAFIASLQAASSLIWEPH